MKKAIITTSNNLVYDNRVHKITLSLIELGFFVVKTGRDFPKTEKKTTREGEEKLFRLPVNKGPFFYFFLNLYTFFFLLFQKYDLIWAVDLDTLPAAKSASILRRKPIVFDGHEFFSELPELLNRNFAKKIWVILEKIFLPGCDRYFTVSPGLVNLYKENFGLEFRLLRNFPLKKRASRVPLVEGKQKIIFYQGALNYGRGIKQTIAALSFLPDNYRFSIAGSGDCENELKQLTQKMGLENRVDFLGAIPFGELHKYHNNAFVGIALHENLGLNYYHSLPNRIFDYAQAGIPVIASNFPDMAECVNTNETGLVIDSMEPGDIATAIKEACENQELRKKWQQTIPIAAQKFTWENEKEIMKDISLLIK
ncbi:glycosyltransferase [Marinilabilia sp.]|uniref:glycosyltransferase n=1 Tax=Marinilabilia sp. TaxID=2021252 RepID=UPI0025BF8061|nr:glycosyltransferase [Marinilabilia sp.]